MWANADVCEPGRGAPRRVEELLLLLLLLGAAGREEARTAIEILEAWL